MPYNRLWRLDVGMRLYQHKPHPHILNRRQEGPVKVTDQFKKDSAYSRFNSKLAVKITNGVGSMTCAYFFGCISLISLPAAIASHNVITIVSWVAQTFFQLVLLSVIIVGQNIQAQATDARAEQTYKDAEAVLSEALQIQAHLAAQDDVLSELREKAHGHVSQDSDPSS